MKGQREITSAGYDSTDKDKKTLMSRGLKVSVVLVGFLAAGTVHAFAGSADPALVRRALERHTESMPPGTRDNTSLANPAAAKVSPLMAFSMQGSAPQASITTGTCDGTACKASLGDCECLMFKGTLTATLLGSANWTAGETVNTDDCTSTGTVNGFCCFGDGTLDATDTTKSANTLSMSFTGTVCVDPNASADLSTSGTFIILPSTAGKFAHSTGTGQINLFSPANTGTSYLAGDGLIQLVSPL